jgi:hypothetical protein
MGRNFGLCPDPAGAVAAAPEPSHSVQPDRPAPASPLRANRPTEIRTDLHHQTLLAIITLGMFMPASYRARINQAA